MFFDLSTSTSPWYQAPVTPSNSVDFDTPTQGIYVGGAGDVSVVRHDGTAVTFTGVPAGSVLPVVARRVNVSGTSASGLVGLWGVGLGAAWSDSAFSPLDLSPVLWLDASDTSTITEVGGAVSQWDDKSGNGNDVTQATAANQPTSGTRTLNGLNVLDFDGSADFLRTGSAVWSLSTATYFFVVQPDRTSGNAMYIVDGTPTSPRHIVGTSPTQYRMYAGTSVNAGTVTTSPQLLQADFTGGVSSTLYRDGVSVLSGDVGSLTSTAATIGASDLGAANWDGLIAEIIIVDGTLTADEIADTETYLADKWGITL